MCGVVDKFSAETCDLCQALIGNKLFVMYPNDSDVRYVHFNLCVLAMATFN
jgi:hypothetical protein